MGVEGFRYRDAADEFGHSFSWQHVHTAKGYLLRSRRKARQTQNVSETWALEQGITHATATPWYSIDLGLKVRATVARTLDRICYARGGELYEFGKCEGQRTFHFARDPEAPVRYIDLRH